MNKGGLKVNAVHYPGEGVEDDLKIVFATVQQEGMALEYMSGSKIVHTELIQNIDSRKYLPDSFWDTSQKQQIQIINAQEQMLAKKLS